MAEKTNKAIYLGDGAYVEFHGYEFIVYTDRSDGRHWVSLEPEMVEKLLRFKREMYDEQVNN